MFRFNVLVLANIKLWKYMNEIMNLLVGFSVLNTKVRRFFERKPNVCCEKEEKFSQDRVLLRGNDNEQSWLNLNSKIETFSHDEKFSLMTTTHCFNL